MEIYNEIARSLNQKTKRNLKQHMMSTGIEIGVISSSGLKLDNFKYEIKDYSILDYLKIDKEYLADTDSIDHQHKVKTPSYLKPLEAGDRVLVALRGNEFIVIGRIS